MLRLRVSQVVTQPCNFLLGCNFRTIHSFICQSRGGCVVTYSACIDTHLDVFKRIVRRTLANVSTETRGRREERDLIYGVPLGVPNAVRRCQCRGTAADPAIHSRSAAVTGLSQGTKAEEREWRCDYACIDSYR